MPGSAASAERLGAVRRLERCGSPARRAAADELAHGRRPRRRGPSRRRAWRRVRCRSRAPGRAPPRRAGGRRRTWCPSPGSQSTAMCPPLCGRCRRRSRARARALALLLRREERLEDARAGRPRRCRSRCRVTAGRRTRPAGTLAVLVAPAPRRARRSASRCVSVPPRGHRVARVDDEVQRRPARLAGVGEDASERRLELQLELDVLAEERGPSMPIAADELVEVERARAPAPASG